MKAGQKSIYVRIVSKSKNKFADMKFNIVKDTVPAQVSRSAHIYRQIFATVAAAFFSFSGGMNMGHTAVLLPQLQNDTTFPYDKKYDSWVASLAPLAMTIGCLFAGSMSDWIGRRMSQVILSIPYVFGWIIMGLSTNNIMLLISRFITGVSFGATRSSGMVFIAELADPKYRSIALVCSSLAIHAGNLVSHTVGKYVYWKYSCFIFAIPIIISLIIMMFLKESPLWLLSNGKIDEGIESFKLYRGETIDSDNELALVLQQCKDNKNKESFQEFLSVIFSKPFVKTLLTTLLLFIAVQWCGVNTIPYYAEYIFQKTFSGDIDAFLLMLISDCIRILANMAICIVSKFFPQRTTLLVCSFITCTLLATVAVYLYSLPTNLLWIPFTCIILYTATGTALTSISWSILPELFPAKIRGFGSGLGSAISFVLLFISVKVTPGIINNFGETALYGSYAFLTLVSSVCLAYLLPDSSGRTLQDIEDSLYKKEQRITIDVISSRIPERLREVY